MFPYSNNVAHGDKKSFIYCLKLVTTPHPKVINKNPEGYKFKIYLDYQLIGKTYLDNFIF